MSEQRETEDYPRTPLLTLHAHLLRILRDHPTVAQERAARLLDVTMRTAQRTIEDLILDGRVTVDKTSKPHKYTLSAQTQRELAVLDQLESERQYRSREARIYGTGGFDDD